MNYRKIFTTLALLACFTMFALEAQINRTTQTIVADVLAQMPASNQKDYNKQIGDLASTGEDGILILARMLKAPAQANSANVEYALSGLVNFVSAPDKAAAKQTTVNALRKAADLVVPEYKAFIADLLRTLGVDYEPFTVTTDGRINAKIDKTTPENVREAAFRKDLKAVDQKTRIKNVLEAMKSPSIDYRNAALSAASDYADRELYVELAKLIRKAKPDVKVDIIAWLGREAMSAARNDVIRNLELRFDLPLRQVLVEQLNSKEFAVKEATAWAMVKIGDPAYLPSLAALLTKADKTRVQVAQAFNVSIFAEKGVKLSDDAEVIVLGAQALASFKGDVPAAVVKVINQASENGKIVALELLALRKASTYINNVLELTKSESPSVRNTAYAALKDVAAEKDLVQLCGMLETAAKEQVKPLQLAVITALSGMSAQDQASTVGKRMLQAGDAKMHLYYLPLAATGSKDALKPIVAGFKSGSGEAKDAAFEAIVAWKGNESVDELYDIAAKGDAKYAAQALNRYVQLAATPSLTPENRLLALRKAMEICKTDEQRRPVLRQIGQTGTFLALMYASEFLDNPALRQLAANAVMNIALEHPEYNGRQVRDLLNRVITILDNADASYQQQSIRKHLAEMPQEEGFVSIFNGKDLSGWKGLVQNPLARARMTPAELAAEQVKADENMRRDWKVVDGLLMFDGKGFDNLCTVKQYGDIEMYVDWLLDTSGKEADAGIYLRGAPQVQIWDTARVKVGAQVGSGGLYNNQKNRSTPLKVADNKLGEWNTFYVKMVGDRVTVILNGELVTDNIILENFWDRKIPIFPVEQLELQAHGSKVFYRNIYVKELERPQPYVLSASEAKEGYKILFDGTNMHEWTGNTVDYTLKDGTITLVPSEGSGGNLYTKDEYGDFVIRFDFMLTPGANNGLGIRTPMEGDAAYVGMELQILDNEAPMYADLKPYQYHGSVYGIIAAKRGFLKPTGEWNTEEVVAKGDNIKITLNGEVILDGNIRNAVKNGTPDGQVHPGLFNKKGHIGFLGHGSEVKFRNIRILPTGK